MRVIHDFNIIIPMETIKISKHSVQTGKDIAPGVALPLPAPVERAIRKLGSDMSLARRRRHISQASLAERIGASVSTIRRMEQGDARVPIHFFARAMQVFGAMSLSPDTPLARLWAWGRALRFLDGPDEVHLRTVARAERSFARACARAVAMSSASLLTSESG